MVTHDPQAMANVLERGETSYERRLEHLNLMQVPMHSGDAY